MRDTFEDHMNMRIKLASENLKIKANSLQRSMGALVNRIESDNLKGINSLGEVQGMGRDVDILCVELRQLMYALEDYKGFEKLKEESK